MMKCVEKIIAPLQNNIEKVVNFELEFIIFSLYVILCGTHPLLLTIRMSTFLTSVYTMVSLAWVACGGASVLARASRANVQAPCERAPAR